MTFSYVVVYALLYMMRHTGLPGYLTFILFILAILNELFGIDCHGLDGSGLDRHGLSIACQVMDLLSLILQQQLSELHMCLIGSLTATRHAVLCVRRTAPHLA